MLLTPSPITFLSTVCRALLRQTVKTNSVRHTHTYINLIEECINHTETPLAPFIHLSCSLEQTAKPNPVRPTSAEEAVPWDHLVSQFKRIGAHTLT
jgi:hypothetical protein